MPGSLTARALLLAGAALTLAPDARAQNQTIVPGAEQFSLPPSGQQPTPTPSPTPAPLPTPTPTAVTPPASVPRASPTPSPMPSRAATPTPSRTPVPIPTPNPTPRAVPTAAATPTAAPSGIETPVATTPVPAPAPTVASSTATTPAGGPPSWLWWLLGVVLLGGGGYLAWRRLSAVRAEPIAYTPEPIVTPPRPAPTPARPVPAGPAAAPRPAPAEPTRALGLDLRPQRLWTRGPDAHLFFDLIVTNTTAGPLSGIRPAMILASAGPNTAAEVADFAAQLGSMPSGEPFDLRAGETRTLQGELTLPGDLMHVTTVNDREMIVPVALVGMTWRGGLSIASLAEAFVVGTGDATAAKLGPVWVDRAGQVYPRLDARRFTPGG